MSIIVKKKTKTNNRSGIKNNMLIWQKNKKTSYTNWIFLSKSHSHLTNLDMTLSPRHTDDTKKGWEWHFDSRLITYYSEPQQRCWSICKYPSIFVVNIFAQIFLYLVDILQVEVERKRIKLKRKEIRFSVVLQFFSHT